MEKMKLDIQLFADGEIVIETKMETKSFDTQIDHLEREMQHYEELYEKYANAGRKLTEEEAEDFEKLKLKMEQTSNKLVDLYRKKRLLEQGNQFEGMRGALGDIVKKVGKWTIAIFGVRSAYNFVRQAVSTLSQSNKTLAKDIENIRYGLASALAPVIQKIVEWAYRLMQAINYIWRVMTGKNLFSNMKKDLNASNKSAKQLQKTIAGFDEMNTLGGNTSGGSGGGVGGAFSQSLTDTNLLSPKQKEILDGIAKTLKEIWKGVLEPLWNNILLPMGKWLLQHPQALLGVLTAIIGLKIGSKIGALTMALGNGSTGLIGALALLDVYLVSKIAKDVKNELIPAIKDTKKRIEEATGSVTNNTKATKSLSKATLEYAKSVEAGDKTLSNNIDFMLKKIRTTDQEIAKEQQLITTTGALTGENKVHKKAIEELDAQMWENINTLGKLSMQGKLTKEEEQAYINIMENEIEKLEKKNEKLNKNSLEYQTNKEKIEALKKQIDITKGNYDVNVKTKADKSPIDTMQKAIDKLKGDYKVNMDADTKKANKVISGWLSNLASVGIFGNFVKAGVSLSKALKYFKYAKGGIINQPGRGIPIGGEAGREGVIPLTDSQQMELLGQAIGKYLTLNATIVNQMNGRVISRELQKIQSENNFAGNR